MEATKYKDSGIYWIEEIPEDWELVPTKRVFYGCKRIVGDKVNEYERLALTMQGVIKRNKEDNEGLQPEKFDGYQILKKNELVFKLIDLQNEKTSRVGISPYEGIVSPAYLILSNKSEDNRYYYYWFMDMYYRLIFNQMADDGVRSALNIKDLLEIPIPNIPLHTQQRIADFLDRKCAEIDELAALQETMIAELKRYKQSVITEAVTGKFRMKNEELRMKPSGVEWIGEIPEGWSVGRIKNVASLFGRIGFRGYTSDDLNKDGIGAITLSPSNMLPMSMDYTNVTYLSWKKYEESPEIKIQNGDLLMVKTGSSYGKVSFVDNLPREATINPQILRIVPNIHSKYLGYFLQTTYFSFQVEGGVVGGTIPTISQEKINNFRVILPPPAEQRAIADYLDKKCGEIDELITIKQQKIEALKEYKKSVIFEYVTGKKEII